MSNLGPSLIYVPLVEAQPIFADVAPVEVPAKYAGAINPELWAILQNSKTLTVRQHVKFLPKACCSCPPCAKQENTYSIYAGLGQGAQAEIMRADEVSDDWNRCCCAPYHPLRLELRQYIPMPGDGSSSDFDHVKSEIFTDFSRFTAAEKSKKAKEIYMAQPPLMSIVRNDGQRCCCKCPCKLLSTCVCMGCCEDGAGVYAGKLEDPDGKEKGRPTADLPQDRLLGKVLQPCGGGWYRPELRLFDQSTDTPFVKVEGPCFFGGWSEMCCDFRFFNSFWDSPSKSGDAGIVTKKKPDSLTGGMRELMSDADTYTIEFESDTLSAEQKATILAGQLLTDYMFFEGNTQKCECESDHATCYLCYCLCLGALVPCKVTVYYTQNG